MLFNRWIYAPILTIDANFRLRLKDKGIAWDPPLGDGWSQWVPRKPFHNYVKKYGGQLEVILLFSSSYSPLLILKLHSPITVTRSCVLSIMLRRVPQTGRHLGPGLLRKNGLGDLRKGER